MKKNNVFMWAYITAIYICVLVRAFVDYALWDSIVLAITVSCGFFAVEDFFSVGHSFLKESCDILKNYIIKAKTNSKEDRDFFEKLKKKLVSDPKLEELNADMNNSYESLIALAKNTISNAELVERQIGASRLKMKKYDTIANILAYLGFLCLFCLVFFSPYIFVSDRLQEIITVMSFAIIMATQQLKQHFTLTIKKETEEYQEMLRRDEMAKKMNPDIEKSFEEILATQKEIREGEKRREHIIREIEELERTINGTQGE